MPDFSELLRTHLAGRRLPANVVEELAAHLEEHYEADLAAGKSQEEGWNSVTSLIGSGERLVSEIEKIQGGIMNSISRHIVLPGLVGSLMSVIGFQLLQLVNKSYLLPLFIGPKEVWGRAGFVPVSIPMVLVLLAAGAAAASIARRLGAMGRAAFYAALFPAAILLLGFVLRIGMDVMQFGSHFRGPAIWWAYAGFFIGFVVVPGLALIAGAMPIVFSETWRREVEG